MTDRIWLGVLCLLGSAFALFALMQGRGSRNLIIEEIAAVTGLGLLPTIILLMCVVGIGAWNALWLFSVYLKKEK